MMSGIKPAAPTPPPTTPGSRRSDPSQMRASASESDLPRRRQSHRSMSDGVTAMIMTNAFSPVANPAQAEKHNEGMAPFRARKSHAHKRLESVVEAREEEVPGSPKREPTGRAIERPPPLSIEDSTEELLSPIKSVEGVGVSFCDGEEKKEQPGEVEKLSQPGESVRVAQRQAEGGGFSSRFLTSQTSPTLRLASLAASLVVAPNLMSPATPSDPQLPLETPFSPAYSTRSDGTTKSSGSELSVVYISSFFRAVGAGIALVFRLFWGEVS